VKRLADGQMLTALSRWREPVYAVVDQLPNLLPPHRETGGPVLLTGATGFLGSYLTASLLEQGVAELRCLVRAPDEATAKRRIEGALRAGPGWDPAWADRLRPLCGDVTAPRLGLDPSSWQAQVDELGMVVHNAANVNFVAPYATLRRTNVDPVHEIVRLTTTGRCLPVHLVSTLAVFNATYRREQRRVRGIDRLQKPDFLYSGYAQSKFVCEAAFRVAGSRGMRLGVHRPGLITGAWGSGHSNPDDFLSRFIRGCVELGVYPDCEVELDLVAVDDVARGIAAATLEPLVAVDTFHWTNPRPVSIPELMRVFADRGHRVEPEPLQRWLHRIRTALPQQNALYAVHPFLLEIPPGSRETILEFMDGLPLDVDALEADTLRSRRGLPRQDVDHAALHRLAARMEQDGLFPQKVTS
jgi:thioester reductase-like protein